MNDYAEMKQDEGYKQWLKSFASLSREQMQRLFHLRLPVSEFGPIPFQMEPHTVPPILLGSGPFYVDSGPK